MRAEIRDKEKAFTLAQTTYTQRDNDRETGWEERLQRASENIEAEKKQVEEQKVCFVPFGGTSF
jgi:hypothetical protein